MKLNYEWTLKDANFTKDQGTVFSCFSCGGGSTMGYKLAGFDVIGFNEIDPKMAECYIANHNPKHAYIEPIQDFKLRNDLPEELYNLDILDGSPPCSSFSMVGNREKDWGKEKKFREGQQNQVLDTLFFDFIDSAKKLQPKIVVAENVKGMLSGNAKEYVSKVLIEFDKAGYYLDYQLLNSSKMGVPQKRERVFFYGVRKDLYKGKFVDLFMTRPLLKLDFDCRVVTFKDIKTDGIDRPLPKGILKFFKLKNKNETCMGETKERITGKRGFFSQMYQSDNKPLYSMTSNLHDGACVEPGRWLNDIEIKRGQTFPLDFDFNGNQVKYMCGMSVPPIMTARIANEINEQWLKELKQNDN